MKQTIWTQRYDINSIVLNHRKRLGLVGLLKILQDTAWTHANHLGHGFDDMLSRNTIWVLTRQKLAMTDWPGWGDIVDIRTWVRPITGPLAQRDYEIFCGDRKLGEGTASWLTLDQTTRRPMKLSLTESDTICRGDGTLATTPEKIAMRPDLAVTATIPARISDLDVNGHVNNVCYAQWILDSLPLEDHSTYRMSEYEINFLGESRLGDNVALEREDLPPSPTAPVRLHFQGKRDSDSTALFAARIGVTPAA